VKYRYNNWIDLYSESGQNLYVNRGFGCLGFEGRVGIWPEVALLTLKRGQSDPV
jgi:predicted MPP superfamily phosphohydrolase